MICFCESQRVQEHKKNLNSNDALIEHVEPLHVIEENTIRNHNFLKSTEIVPDGFTGILNMDNTSIEKKKGIGALLFFSSVFTHV